MYDFGRIIYTPYQYEGKQVCLRIERGEGLNKVIRVITITATWSAPRGLTNYLSEAPVFHGLNPARGWVDLYFSTRRPA